MAHGPRHDDQPADRGACSGRSTPSSPWSPLPPAGPARSTRTSTSSATASATWSRRRSASVSRKPLSIGFEEIAAAQDRVDRAPVEPEFDADAEAQAIADAAGEGLPVGDPTPDRRFLNRAVACRVHSPASASSSASPGASPPTRPSRSAAASSMPARTSCPIMTAGAERFIGRTTLSALASRAGADRALGRPGHPDPAHQDSARGPTSSLVAPATARLIGAYAAGSVDRPAHQHAARHPCAGRRLPGHAHRDVGAPGRRRQHRRAARAAACTSSSPASGGSPAATPAPVAWPTRSGSSPRSNGCSGRAISPGVRVVGHRRRHPRADRRRAGHRQPQLRQAGLRHRRRGRWPGAPTSRSSRPSTCRRPPAPTSSPGRDRGRDAGRGAAGRRRRTT